MEKIYNKIATWDGNPTCEPEPPCNALSYNCNQCDYNSFCDNAVLCNNCSKKIFIDNAVVIDEEYYCKYCIT